jgi:hypothetical protein
MKQPVILGKQPVILSEAKDLDVAKGRDPSLRSG